MEYGSIYTSSASTALAGIGTGTAWTKVTSFTALAPANGVGVNHGIDELEPLNDGDYSAFANLGFAGTLDTQYEFAIMVDDVVTTLRSDAGINSTSTGTATDVTTSINGILGLSAGDRVALAVRANTTGTSVTIKSGQLGLYKLG